MCAWLKIRIGRLASHEGVRRNAVLLACLGGILAVLISRFPWGPQALLLKQRRKMKLDLLTRSLPCQLGPHAC